MSSGRPVLGRSCLDRGRRGIVCSGRGMVCFLFLVCLMVINRVAWADAPNERGSRFALLVTIGRYAGLPGVPGAQRDRGHARTLAKALGVPDGNIIAFHDGQASAENIRRALAELALDLAPADRVLIYFSGMGSRQQDLDHPGGCEEIFIAADGTFLGFGELAELLLPVAERAEKTMVIVDACASAPKGGGAKAVRCVLPPAGDDCRPGSNMRWRSLVTEIRRQAVPTANIVMLQAAKPEEAVFDEGAGGPFTAALHDCSLDNASDRDQSGAVSFMELSICIQRVVSQRFGSEGKAAQVMLNGNQGLIPFVSRGAGAGTGPGSVLRLFDDLTAGRDGRKTLVMANVWLNGGPSISLRASSIGYLYLLSSDQNGMVRLLYPSSANAGNLVRSGETFVFPKEGAVNPLRPGMSVLALLTDSERDINALPAAPGGGFFVDGSGHKALFDFATTSARAAAPDCQAVRGKRNLSLWRACSDAYGAAMLIVPPDR